MEVNDAECMEHSFQTHYIHLFEQIQDPTSLTARLYSAGLLSRQTRQTIIVRESTMSGKVAELLEAVETAIAQQPLNFFKFVKQLNYDPTLCSLHDKMMSTFSECLLLELVL